jgi:N6-adenosine-specific RNA methylase IME4
MTKFDLVYIDFPWKYNARNNSETKFGTGMHKYNGMSIEEIKSLPIQDICAENCVIVAWAVGAKMDEFFDWQRHMTQFGFRYATQIFSWLKVSKEGKPRSLPGYYSLSNVETAFLLVRGSVPVVKKGNKQVLLDEIDEELWQSECLKPHSKKPIEIRHRLDSIFGSNIDKLELFSRQSKKFDEYFWVNAGNEVGETLGLDIRDAFSQISDGTYILTS